MTYAVRQYIDDALLGLVDLTPDQEDAIMALSLPDYPDGTFPLSEIPHTKLLPSRKDTFRGNAVYLFNPIANSPLTSR